jgi:hypothetical protein
MHPHRLGLSLAFTFTFVAACGADSTKPTASGVFPAEGFTGRQLRVEISGDATSWKDGATVSFGDGVTVNSVDVASPTDLFATISIDPTAAPGLRDVAVMSGGTYTLKQAFQLQTPVGLAFVGGTDQGGFPAFTITNRDFENPFDGTTDSTGAFTSLTVKGPSGTKFQVQSVSPYQITGFVSIDTDAMSGAVMVTSGQITSITDAMPVKPRTATPLTSNTPMTGMIAGPNDSALYSLTAAGSPSLVHVSAKSTDPNAAPLPSILGGSGHWADQLGNSWALLQTGGPVYVVVFDAGMAAGYSFSVSAAGEMLTSVDEGNDTTNNTAPGALAATSLPFAQAMSSLSSPTDVDYVKFTAPSGNKRVHVVTTAGTDPQTDTVVDVLGGAGGMTSFTPDGGPEDQTQCSLGCTSLGEEFVSTPLPAGTTYIAVSAGPNYSPTHKSYVLMFWLE